MTENKLRIFEYTEKHYPDQYLKIKITLDQESYNFWKPILNDKDIKEDFKQSETKYKGKFILDFFADPLPEKIEDLEEEKIIPMFYFVRADAVNNLGDYEENSDFKIQPAILLKISDLEKSPMVTHLRLNGMMM